jgi:hypothetical protein
MTFDGGTKLFFQQRASRPKAALAAAQALAKKPSDGVQSADPQPGALAQGEGALRHSPLRDWREDEL